MLQTVKAKYRNGVIELPKQLNIPGEADVLVTFLENTEAKAQKFAKFGALSTGKYSAIEDFKSAEWHGEEFEAK